MGERERVPTGHIRLGRQPGTRPRPPPELWWDDVLCRPTRLRERGCGRVIHWSPAEVVTFESAYNAAKERHLERDWPSPRWFDFLGEVMREEPVVVRGAFGFGLKAIAKAMHGHGLIDTLWDDGPADGLGAMVGAWWCQDQGVPLMDLVLMSEIVEYNEVDCRVMMEAVCYLRAAH